MVHKKLLELLVNLAIAFLVLSVSISESCHLSQGTFYNRCLSGINCTSGIDCVSEPVVVYDWMWDLGGCDLGCAAGQLYDVYDANSVQCTGSIYGKTCQCYVKEAKWKKSCSNKDICKLRWNPLCDGEFEGKWDASEGKCVKCSGKKQVEAHACGYEDHNVKCESACGAANKCDEKAPETGWCEGSVANLCYSDCSYSSRDYSKDLCDEPGVLWINGECIADTPGFSCADCKIEKGCVYYGVWCDSDSKCDEKSCGGSNYICDGNDWVKMETDDDDLRLQCELVVVYVAMVNGEAEAVMNAVQMLTVHPTDLIV